MFALIDIRKSALTLLAAAVLSTAAGLAASAQASIASSGHRASVTIAQATGTDAHEHGGRNEHRLARPANRFNGFVGTPGPKSGSMQGQ
ncbi:hypothetical protein [Phreatobacter stygius]|uniref:Uncharacterized protein n=1 Tax=Phreatobacter stygius TaxID=1940610 RepID=A0A4D7AYN6_9HYPH|nr:hypothetical protein [Phreatobacter stygius]QCI64515.1 hypothetical protein E8M01_09865 [Phreatobacter stygius]